MRRGGDYCRWNGNKERTGEFQVQMKIFIWVGSGTEGGGKKNGQNNVGIDLFLTPPKKKDIKLLKTT